MKIEAPYHHIRTPHYGEMKHCCDLVFQHWGEGAAARCYGQFIEYWKGGAYSPVFYVAVDKDDNVIGFAAIHRSMQCTFNIIWLVVAADQQGRGVGKCLVEVMMDHVESNDGMLTEVITQEKLFYQKLGFFQAHHLGQEWYLMLKPTGEFGL